ncbi:hypothetical protein [Evansella cellulosilytica]|uniref:Uncharacterized protein n=1 Tax=Evansella cellulosilytica (strain ATCC 21833 / DSM 2522 / FERM P-1141 / JCM 9156 / N-4) TaxID=649639 RepID=E6TQX7_EVAC2|nr:hypothetical protein [Evansella cellulosilytica]ADU31752.1 hypothetical protein Bcell_3510 [Evansella cellulosilytica DSM 2522]
MLKYKIAINVISTIIVFIFVFLGYGISNMAESNTPVYNPFIFAPLFLLILGAIFQQIKKTELIGLIVVVLAVKYCLLFLVQSIVH